MKATYIDYSDTHSFSSAVISYIQQKPELKPFISFEPTYEGFKKLLALKKSSVNREVLTTVLKKQYAELLESGKESISLVEKNINLLLEDNTYTITTGHQLNIFAGPLYFIYKIVTAINLARELKAQHPDKNFVPIYWMATEDHDFAEINHTNLQGEKIDWNISVSGATGRLNTASIEKTLRHYQSVLGVSEYADKLSKLVEEAYDQKKNLADATRILVNSIFESFGLVILDADDAQLKRLFAPVIERDILQQNSFREINETSSELKCLGIHPQVNSREINFFYLKDDIRERIVFEEGNYSVLNTSIQFSADELKEEIQLHPERFSPNVVLRPLYQEIILPNLAYVGGGAEIVYWLQLKKNFDFYKIDFPILVLRNSALLATPEFEVKLKRLDIGFTDLFKSSEELKKEWVLKHSVHDLSLTAEEKEIHSIFEKIKAKASKIDSTLSPSTDAVQARLNKALKKLEAKLIKAEKRNYSTSLSQIDAIKNKLFPNGSLQERSENFGMYYVKHGDQLILSLIDSFKPLDFKFTILY